MAATTAERLEKKSASLPVPDLLVKEVIDGIPVYYKGYRDVLANTKQPEEIMADGLLQVILKSWIARILMMGLDESKYWIGVGEVGSHISRRNNMAHDVAIFSRESLPAGKIGKKYADVPAELVLEIDTEVEYGAGLSTETYIHRKTQNTLDFGTRKVIWIFTATKKIMVAERNRDWITTDWDKSIELLDGVTFNVAHYLTEQGVSLSDDE